MSIEQFSRFGLAYNGVKYDYNIERYGGDALTLEGYYSYDAKPSEFTYKINKLFNSSGLLINSPFIDHYGLVGIQPFLVYRFPIEKDTNHLPGVAGSVLEEIKPIDFCIHAENLYKKAWENYQKLLGLPFLMLKEWPETLVVRRTISELDYPRFIDSEGAKRAKWDTMLCQSYNPGKIPEVVDVKSDD